jgi:hypothetical protein
MQMSSNNEVFWSFTLLAFSLSLFNQFKYGSFDTEQHAGVHWYWKGAKNINTSCYECQCPDTTHAYSSYM